MITFLYMNTFFITLFKITKGIMVVIFSILVFSLSTMSFLPSVTAGSEDCLVLDPNQVEVQQIGTWKIVQGGTWLLDFGSNQAEAETSLDIIKHYGFNDHKSSNGVLVSR